MPTYSRGFLYIANLAWALCASLVEIAPMLDALQHGGALSTVLLFGLAYQIGNGLSRWLCSQGVVIVLIAATGLATSLSLDGILPAQFFGVAAVSLALQMSRRSFKSCDNAPTLPTIVKRLARVLGFVLAAVVPVELALGIVSAVAILSGTILMLAFTSDDSVVRPSAVAPDHTGLLQHVGGRRENGSRLGYLMIMLIHQMHYFVYAYGIIDLTFRGFGNANIIAASLFAAGWVTYLSAQALWKRFPEVWVFIAGHLFLTACLLGIAWSAANALVSSVLWVLTGFGGGTVYCLTTLSRAAGLKAEQIEASEDVGHVAGVGLALALVTLAGANTAELALSGATLALSATIFMLLRYWRSRQLSSCWMTR